MDLPDPKQLKKLADYCRKAGIKTYECAECKITLADQYTPAPSAYLRKKAGGEKGPKTSIQGHVASDTLSSEELLFYSAGVPPEGIEPGDLQ